MLSYARFKTPSRQPVVRRIQKRLTTKRGNNGSSASRPREEFTPFNPAKLNRVRNNKFSRSSFATGSDGFLGAELTVQHTRRPIKPRANNKTRIERSVHEGGGLVLVCGRLPSPPFEYHEGAFTLAEKSFYTENRTPTQTPTRIVDRQPLSQSARAEVRKAMIEKDARRRRTYSPRSALQQHGTRETHLRGIELSES